MTAPNIALVNTEAATEFVMGIQRDTQLTAWLGSVERFQQDAEVSGAIISARTALRNGGAKITELTGDLTRSEPERHHVGAEVSARTVTALENARSKLMQYANAYEGSALAAVKERFTLRSEDNWIYDKWLGFVRQQYSEEGGPANIRENMLKHRDLATLFVKMPTPLLGIPEVQHDDWKLKAVEKWEPEIQEAAQMGADIRDLASRYPRVIAMVKTNFHSPVIASRMKTRVSL
ncbi:hypothetical protein J4558_01550 [Leptolyngbya sp. 15MV]|nr:hypothetical protein J4558_01550 [Leptolyngbya sp. 15MV]